MLKLLFQASLVLSFITAPVHAALLEDHSQFITHYYRSPDANQAMDNLTALLSSPELKEGLDHNLHAIAMMAYFYARLAEDHPAMGDAYRGMYEAGSEEARSFFWLVWLFHRDAATELLLQEEAATAPADSPIHDVLADPPRGRDGVVKPVENPNDLDYLWIEFFYSGQTDAIEPMVDVLAHKDLIRGKLFNLNLTPPSAADAARLKTVLKEGMAVNMDPANFDVDVAGDLDARFSAMAQQSGFSGERSVPAMELVRLLKISQDDVLYIATKGAAMWALRSNAQEHPALMEYLKTERDRRTGKVVVELSVITGEGPN